MQEKSKYELLDSLIKKGIKGTELGALFSKKEESTFIKSLIGASLSGSYEAFNSSRKLKNGVLYIENDGNLYRALPDGSKVFVKEIKRSQVNIPKSFTID